MRPAFCLALALLLGLAAGAEQPVCSVCGQTFSKGFKLKDGSYVCAQDLKAVSPHCAVCGRMISGDYHTVPGRDLAFCDTCHDTLPHCFTCGLPVAEGGFTLPDGRVICQQDREQGVFTPAQAYRLYKQAEREVVKTFGSRMSLGIPVAAVELVDQDTMLELMDRYEAGSFSRAVSGLTRVQTTTSQGRRVVEPPRIYLLSGMPAVRTLTVATHEYAHAWHAQNHPNYGRTSRSFREGFAEWVALKVAQYYERQGELDSIAAKQDPDYAYGLRAFVEVERSHGVDGVLDFALREASFR